MKRHERKIFIISYGRLIQCRINSCSVADHFVRGVRSQHKLHLPDMSPIMLFFKKEFRKAENEKALFLVCLFSLKNSLSALSIEIIPSTHTLK